MAEQLLAPGGRIYVKDATQNVTNSTTKIDDADLKFDAPAGATYYIQGFLHAIGGDDALDDETLKYNLAVPAGSTYSIGSGAALAANGAVADLTVATINGVTEGGDFITFTAYVKVGTTAGTVKLQWAQNAATADGVTLQIGSHIRVTPLNARASF